MTIEYKDSKRIQALSGETYYQEADGNSGASMSNGGIYYAYGTEIRAGHSSITKKADKWTIRFGRNNSPQGVVEAHIYTGTEGATSKTHSQTSTNSITVDALSTSGADYSFTFATPHTISAGDVFAIVWKTDTSTSGSNYIDIKLFNALTDMPNTRNYMVSTANWDGSDDDGHTWSVAPSPYTTYTLTSKLELIAGKTLITNVQDNSILVEKDTGRRYWFDEATSDYTQYGWAVDSSTKIQTLGASASLPSSGTFTWSFWYRPNSISAEHYLFNKLGSSSGEYSPRLYLQTTGALKATSTTNNVGYGGNAITSNVMTIGSWNHVICKQTGNTIYAILNNGTASSASVISGNNSGEDYQFFLNNTGVDGDIKNAILYSTALSASDITALYNSGTPATSSTAGVTSNILIEHIFDSDTSTTSAVNTGSLGGSASVIAGTASVVGTPATWTWSNDSTRGLFAGANSASDNTIDYITIATLSNASDFGDLTQGRTALTGLESDTRGVFGGGYTGSNVATMDYVTIATTGDATSFGSLITARRHFGSVSNNTRGVFGGGYVAGNVSGMEYITIAVPSGGAVQGNDVTARRWAGGVSSETRGVFGGGWSSSNVLSMDYVTISSTGSTTSFGNLTVARGTYDGLSNGTRGMFLGGYGSTVNVIDYITIATTGNATDFGDLTVPRQQVMGASNASRGILAGGADGSASYTSIDYITISTPSNTTNFGDLIISKVEGGAVQG